MNDPEEYLAAALQSVSKGIFYFEKIPDSRYINALSEFTTDCEFYFPLNKSVGNVHEMSCESWSACAKQIRLESSDLDEDPKDIKKFSEVEHLVLELDNLQEVPQFEDEAISDWQACLMDYQNLKSFKIILYTRKSIGKNKGGSGHRAELEAILDDLKWRLNPFTDGKFPETAIERRK